MPLYNYVDKNTEKAVEILRKFDDYEVHPTKEEAKDLTQEEYDAADWERRICPGIRVTRGENWNGSKGNW